MQCYWIFTFKSIFEFLAVHLSCTKAAISKGLSWGRAFGSEINSISMMSPVPCSPSSPSPHSKAGHSKLNTSRDCVIQSLISSFAYRSHRSFLADCCTYRLTRTLKTTARSTIIGQLWLSSTLFISSSLPFLWSIYLLALLLSHFKTRASRSTRTASWTKTSGTASSSCSTPARSAATYRNRSCSTRSGGLWRRSTSSISYLY